MNILELIDDLMGSGLTEDEAGLWACEAFGIYEPEEVDEPQDDPHIWEVE